MKKNNGWNYRVIKMPDKKLKGLPQTYSWGIYEVYYTNDKPTSWSADPIYPIGESWNELMDDYHIMFQAFTKPTLELKGDKLIESGRFK
jgi:hypothetical protein